jgi:phosphoribosylglycinamide formyltransferase-1|tara:strand:- start:131 stop:829 length:699 start_codon:yes stop_codon:yes gene_type:complete
METWGNYQRERKGKVRLSNFNQNATATVLISGSGSNLQAFIDLISSKILKLNILAVISDNKNAHGLIRAKKAKIKTICIENKKYPNKKNFDQKLSEIIDMFDPNFIFLAGFMRILRKDFVKKYEGKIINIHPSLLPKYPGLNTHQRAIESNEKWHGCSVHFVTEEVDEGPLIMQSKIPILNNDSSDKLAIRVLKREHIIYPKTAELLISGRIKYKNSQAWLDGKLLQKPIMF